MKAIATYKHNGTLQRELLTHNGRTYRRIVRLWDDHLRTVGPLLDQPHWQEQIHTGEFHNVSGTDADALETAYRFPPAVAPLAQLDPADDGDAAARCPQHLVRVGMPQCVLTADHEGACDFAQAKP